MRKSFTVALEKEASPSWDIAAMIDWPNTKD
jgi:hypothetical protein